MNKSWHDIKRKLGVIRAWWRCVSALSGAVFVFVPVAILLSAGVVSELHGMPRLVLLMASAGWFCVSSLMFIVWPVVRPLSLLDIAFMVEKRNVILDGRLSAAVDVHNVFEKNEFRGSEEKLDALVGEAAGLAADISVARSIDFAVSAKKMLLSVVVIVLSAAVPLISGKNYHDVARFAMPPYMPSVQIYRILWVSGDITVATGDSAEVFAAVESTSGEVPLLELEREGLEPFEISMDVADKVPDDAAKFSDNSKVVFYSGMVESVAGDMYYRVRGGKAETEKYHIFTIQPPVMNSIFLSMKYPPHTGLLPDEKKDSGDIRVPFGTRVDLKVEASSELSSALIQLGEDSIPLVVDGKNAGGSFTVKKSVRYSVRITDKNGFENRFPPEYLIESVEDTAPEIRLLFPEGDITISRISELGIRGSAVDDYGVSSVRVQHKVVGTKKSNVERIPIAPGRNLLFEYNWDLSGVEAYEGDTLEYYLCATDNDELKGPKTACSEARKLTLLSRFEDFQQAREKVEDVVDGMNKVLRDGDNISEKFRDLAMSLDKSKAGERKWRGEAERVVSRQQALEQELKSLSENMSDAIEQMKNNDLVNLDTLSTMQEINRMMDQIMTDEIRDLIKKVQENISQVNLNNVDKKMLESMADQKKIMDSLQQTLDRLKKIRAEQQMEALRKQLENLAERQERLAEKSESLGKESAKDQEESRAGEMIRQAREQEKIHDETESTLESMKDLAMKIGELSPEQGRKIQGLSEVAEKEALKPNMKKAEEKLRERKISEATKNEKAARNTLQKMSASMNMAGDEYMKEMAEKEKKMAMDLLRRTLDISSAHEKVLDENEKAIALQHNKLSGRDLGKMVEDEKISADTLQKLRQELYQLSVLSMVVQPDVIWYSADAYKSLEESIRSLAEEHPTVAVGFQKQAAGKLNQLAIALLDAGKRMGMPSAKSAMDDFMDQLQKLAGSQESLNAETQRFGESGIPMPGMGDAMGSMAMQQQLIKEGVGKLMEEMGRMGQDGERLSQIQKEMEEIQKAMLGGDAGREVQRQQATVLRRLQDASLSLRKESLEDKRVAEKAGEYEVEKPVVRDLLLESLPESVREELNKFRNDPRPDGYESLIERYYNELMRTGE